MLTTHNLAPSKRCLCGPETTETLTPAHIEQRAPALRDQLTLDEKIQTVFRVV